MANETDARAAVRVTSAIPGSTPRASRVLTRAGDGSWRRSGACRAEPAMMRLGSVLLASGLLALGGCSLLSGLDELSANANEASGGAAGDAGGGPICLPGKKACSGDCVPIDAPATGCAALSCAPCDLARASAICVGGACVIAQCAAGFEDCNGDSNDGCEADLKIGVTSCAAVRRELLRCRTPT